MKNTLTARGHATKWRVWGPRNQTTQVHARVLQRTPWRASGGFIKPLWDLTSSSKMAIITTPNIPRLLSSKVTGGVFSFLLTRAFVCLITKITNYLLWKQIAKKRKEMKPFRSLWSQKRRYPLPLHASPRLGSHSSLFLEWNMSL